MAKWNRLVCAAGLAVVSVTASCGDDDSSGGDGGETSVCEENGVSVSILRNHPSGSHELSISVADVLAGVDQSYDIQGNNTGHGHTLTVTAADFASLAAGNELTLESTDTGAAGMDHTHEVVLHCNGEG